ncbi:MAG: Gldg family protein [Pseudomonadales bacterium]|nr:Gldg family protein [Pseudomonadales bacterium]
MKTKRLFSGMGLVVVAGIVLVSTVLFDRLFTNTRIDLTENNLYTLSEGSRNVVAGLERPVDLFFFFSKTATKDALAWRNYAKQVRELLVEFELASAGNVRLHVIDPEPFSEEEDQAAEYGLEAVNLAAGADPVYFGMAVISGDGGTQSKEVVPFFQPDRQELLEYDIARMMYQASRVKKPKVGLISNLEISGGFDMMSQTPKEPWFVMKQLGQLFEISELRDDVQEIDADIDLLVVVHPKDLPLTTLFAMDQFVLRGGRLLVFVDPFSERDPMGAQQPGADLSSTLPRLFDAWGVKFDTTQFIGDYQLALQVSSGQGQAPFKHLAILQLTDANHGEKDITTGQLESLNFSSAGYLLPAEGATTIFKPLLLSSEYAMPLSVAKIATGKNPKDLAKDFNPTGEQYVLAARISGAVKSAFPDGVPVDEGDGETEAADKGELNKDASNKEYLTESVNDIQVMIVADSDLLTDRLWTRVQAYFGQSIAQPFADNGSFFVNSVDALSGSSDLISIRSRGRFIRPFTVVQDMRYQAEAAFREKEEQLQQQLMAAEQKLVALQNQRDDSGNMLTLSPEQEVELIKFQDQKLAIRKQLREVQHQLNQDIDNLDMWLKVINIALVPALLTFFAIGIAMYRRRAISA